MLLANKQEGVPYTFPRLARAAVETRIFALMLARADAPRFHRLLFALLHADLSLVTFVAAVLRVLSVVGCKNKKKTYASLQQNNRESVKN